MSVYRAPYVLPAPSWLDRVREWCQRFRVWLRHDAEQTAQTNAEDVAARAAIALERAAHIEADLHMIATQIDELQNTRIKSERGIGKHERT